jgi:5-methyltetrahydrofolate--homocysteine methyltransferase
MSYVATEMARQEFSLPLLIGGATTSKAHTAVKIAPHYPAPVIYVTDASRAVGTVSNLLSKTEHDPFVAGVRTEYDAIRDAFYDRQDTADRYPLDEARALPAPVTWDGYTPPAPKAPGLTVLEVPLERIRRPHRLDAVLPGVGTGRHLPEDPGRPDRRRERSRGFQDAQEMLHRIVEERWLTARAVVGLWPANSRGRRHRGVRGRVTRRGAAPWSTR